jgi:diaminopimelate epimerase
MHALRFSKMHGAGNDFVVLDRRSDPSPLQPGLCRVMADRHTGIGCDQILTIEPPRTAGAAASYRIWNADGSSAQQCGNGARCVAAWVLRDSVARDPERCLADRFDLDSPTGTHSVDVLGLHHYRIGMGRPVFDPTRIPLHGFAAAQAEYALAFDGEVLADGQPACGDRGR